MTNEDFMTRVLVTLNDIQMELKSVKAENAQLLAEKKAKEDKKAK